MRLNKRDKEGQQAPHKPTAQTREKVRVLSCYSTQDTIAKLMGLDKKTLRKHYRKELDHGKAEIDQLAVGLIVSLIREGDRTAAIYYTKARMGWREGQVLEVTGKDGEPLQQTVIYLPDNGRGDRPA
jgi:hypothetical protein